MKYFLLSKSIFSIVLILFIAYLIISIISIFPKFVERQSSHFTRGGNAILKQAKSTY